MRTRTLLVALWLASVTPAMAEMFSYRDAQGNLHFVDQEAAIPREYRANTTGGGPPATSPAPRGVFNSVQSASGSSDGAAPAPEQPGSPGDGTGGSGALTCALRYVEQPTKTVDLRYATITYRGTVENGGNGLARGVQAHLKLFSAIDGSQIESASGVLSPSNLDPRERGTFEVKGYYRKQGLRNPERDDLMIDYVRCDPSSQATAPVTPAGRCSVQLVGKPDKTIDTVAQTLTYVGSVQNNGEGVAKTVQVELTRFALRDGAPMAPVYVNVNPSRLGPGESGSFTLVAPREFGFRDPDKDKLEVRVPRCD